MSKQKHEDALDARASTPILSRLRPPKGATRPKRRVGRGPGSGLGKTGGRGMKGAKARDSGALSKLGFEGGQTPLFRRLPKPGFKNPCAKSVKIVNVGDLNSFQEGSVVDEAALRSRGLVKGGSDEVKLLGQGEVKVALVIKLPSCSSAAKRKIEAAGGKFEALERSSAKA